MTDGPTKLDNLFKGQLADLWAMANAPREGSAANALRDAVQGRLDATVNAPKPTGHAAVASEIERALAAFRAPQR
jgi:hypothetical protein